MPTHKSPKHAFANYRGMGSAVRTLPLAGERAAPHLPGSEAYRLVETTQLQQDIN